MALDPTIMAGLMGTQKGLLQGFGQSLAPMPVVNPEDPVSLRAASAEAMRRGDQAMAQQYGNMANALERNQYVKRQELAQNTMRTQERGDMRLARSRAMQAESDAMLEDMQLRERFKANRDKTAKVLRDQGKSDLADMVSVADNPQAVSALMNHAFTKDPKKSWREVELDDGIYAVDSENPNVKVRLGALPQKPADPSTAGLPASKVTAAQQDDRYTGVFEALKNINDKLPNWSPMKQGATEWVWGSEARSIVNDLKTVGGNAAFDRLQQMRDESKTGGALGQVSNIELELLKSTIAAMDPKDKDFPRHIKTIEGVYKRTRALDKLVSTYGEDGIAEIIKLPNGYKVRLTDGSFKQVTY